MSALTPQPSGSSHLGSRNPFLQRLTPQPTGAPPQATGNPNLSGDKALPSPPTSPVKSPTAERARSPDSGPAMPRLERQTTGALNSVSSPEPSSPPRIVLERAGSSYGPPSGPPPRLPPRSPAVNLSTPSAARSPPQRNSTMDFLQEELPPEYTPGPDARAGEQTVELGPLRPFQNVQPVWPTPGANDSYIPNRRPGPSRPGANPGSLREALSSLLLAALTEAPRRTPSSGAFSAPPGGHLPYGTSTPSRPSMSPQPSAPYGVSRPSGPPQPTSPRVGWSQYPGQRPVQRQRSLTPEPLPRVPDDGKPTSRPTPGHPLLRDGKVLVYPLGHECRKCFNKGFRPVHASTFDPTPRALAPGDPSNPCKRCWRQHARPYTTALAQLDWNETVETNFQRPISDPNVVSRSSVPYSPSMNHGPVSPPMNVRSPPSNFGLGYPGQRAAVAAAGSRPPTHWVQNTPTGSITFMPGDRRIGGRVCPRCHGSGRTRVFILETESCNMCQGIGRVFF